MAFKAQEEGKCFFRTMIKYLDIQAITAQHAAEYQAAARRVIDSGWYLLGNETEAFEKQYAHYIGTKHCIGVANGLDALRLMLRAYKELGRMQEGDEVIVPANTYIATISHYRQSACACNGRTPF